MTGLTKGQLDTIVLEFHDKLKANKSSKNVCGAGAIPCGKPASHRIGTPTSKGISYTFKCSKHAAQVIANPFDRTIEEVN